MINFIRKIFIKDYQNIQSSSVREKHGLLAAFGGLFINLILFSFKLAIGIITFSFSIITDAVNNITDFLSCIVTLLGFKIANMPADKKHPYGHERVEYITGMIISFIIISVAVVLGYTSIIKLINHESIPQLNIYAFIILGVSILLKIILGLFYKGLGNAINSESLKASKQDSFNDALCTTGVLIAALINYFINDIYWLDPAISLCIALFIFASGIKSCLETASPLIGTSIDPKLIKNITFDILNYNGILGVHDINAHSYGHSKTFITLHAEVDGYENMIETHEIIDKIEYDLNKKYNIELTIHIDPIDTKNKKLPILKKQIMQEIKNIEPTLTIHDLHVIEADDKKKIIFDILKNNNCKISDNDLLNKVKEKVESISPKYEAIIKIDHDFS